MTPTGKTVLSVVIPTDYGCWDEIGRSKQKYEVEKARVNEAVINAIAERHPEIRSKTEA